MILCEGSLGLSCVLCCCYVVVGLALFFGLDVLIDLDTDFHLRFGYGRCTIRKKLRDVIAPGARPAPALVLRPALPGLISHHDSTEAHDGRHRPVVLLRVVQH